MKKKIKKTTPMTTAMLRRAATIAIALCAVAIAAVAAKAAFLDDNLPDAACGLASFAVAGSAS